MFCWISAAVIALVTLRKGASAGGWLFLWALLPSGTLLYVFGDSGPLALLAGTMFLALVLRNTVSLSLAILASVAVGGVTGLALVALGGEYLDQIVTYFGEFLAALEQQLSQGDAPVVLPRPNALQIAGMLGAGTALTSVLCLLQARYWQSALYNPGGFGREFKSLFYPATVSMSLAVALFFVLARYRFVLVPLLIPLAAVGCVALWDRVLLARLG